MKKTCKHGIILKLSERGMFVIITKEIKHKILQLDAGTFQSLCDDFLSEEHPDITIMSLGTHSSSMKTTKGTPDTYFVTKTGNYVFVEYTTKLSDIAAKIKSDIDKCFDESQTKVPINKISEIIYCHTSSNLTPGDDLELRNYCTDKGVQLTLLGIDQIAERLSLFHRNLVKQYFNISFDTNQIKSSQQFVKDYDAKKISAPLTTEFCFREKEIEELDSAFSKVNITILVGQAGVGKSRLALYYSQLHASQNNERVLCISSNDLPIWEDFNRELNEPGKYFVFIDDANELAGLKYILNYAVNHKSDCEIRILITVRDYALRKITNDLRTISSYKTIDISPFTDNQIKHLSEKHYGITNELYLERIANIAKGNARIAMLAGKIASETNKLESINDLTDLFNEYYCYVLKDQLSFDDKKLIMSAGLVAYLSPLDLNDLDSLQPIFDMSNLDRLEFIDNLHTLHRQEIIQIHYDRVVRFDEQCLSNYLLKLVLIDKKYFSIQKMIKICIDKYHSKTIKAMNAILGVFQSETAYKFIKSEVSYLWRELEQNNDPNFHRFVMSFCTLNRTKALIYVDNLVTNSNSDCQLPTHEEIISEKKKQEADDILEILSSFANTKELDVALDIFFKYYLKRCKEFGQFYYVAKERFNIDFQVKKHGYYTPRMFIKKILEYSKDMTDDRILTLFLELVPEFLKFSYSSIESNGEMKATYYTLTLHKSDELTAYRADIWDAILKLNMEQYYPYLISLLDNYALSYNEDICDIVCAEASYLLSIIEKVLNSNELKHCLIVERLSNILDKGGYPQSAIIEPFLNTQILRYYRLLVGSHPGLSYHERIELQKKDLIKFIDEFGLEGVCKLIDTCEASSSIINNTWNLQRGLSIAFEVLKNNTEYYLDAVRYYIKKNTPLNIRVNDIVHFLLSNFDVNAVHEIIFSPDYTHKDKWKYAYFSEMPVEKITKIMCLELYEYLRDHSDISIKQTEYRDICMFDKYRHIDAHVFINACRIVCDKFQYSPFIANIYFSLMFNDGCHSINEIMSMFEGHYPLLSRIYISAIQYDRGTDCKRKYIKSLYSVYPEILNEYVEYLHKEASQYTLNDNKKQALILFELEKSTDIIIRIVDKLISLNPHPYSVIRELFEVLLADDKNQVLQEAQDKLIRHFITTYSHDKLRMSCLFNAITKMTDDKRIEYIILFLQQTQSIEEFKSIPLFSYPFVWSNSSVPIYSRHKGFLLKLLPLFQSIRFLLHKEYIEEMIANIEKHIEREQIKDILEQ